MQMLCLMNQNQLYWLRFFYTTKEMYQLSSTRCASIKRKYKTLIKIKIRLKGQYVYVFSDIIFV